MGTDKHPAGRLIRLHTAAATSSHSNSNTNANTTTTAATTTTTASSSASSLLLADFCAVARHSRLVVSVAGGVRLAMFDTARARNRDLTSDAATCSALFNSSMSCFATAAGQEVRLWRASDGRLQRVLREITPRGADITAVSTHP